MPFSGLVPSVSEDHVRCNGRLGSVHSRALLLQEGQMLGERIKDLGAGFLALMTP